MVNDMFIIFSIYDRHDKPQNITEASFPLIRCNMWCTSILIYEDMYKILVYTHDFRTIGMSYFACYIICLRSPPPAGLSEWLSQRKNNRYILICFTLLRHMIQNEANLAVHYIFEGHIIVPVEDNRFLKSGL